MRMTHKKAWAAHPVPSLVGACQNVQMTHFD
mgnify:CR=1 FL=1